MQVLTLLYCMSMIFMVRTLSFPISPNQISLDWFWPSEFGQLLNQWKELLIRDSQRGELKGLLFLFVLFSSLLSRLVIWGLWASSFAIFVCWPVSDQNLLRTYSNIILEHSILILLSKQIVHQGGQLLARDSKNEVLGLILLLKI